MVDEQFLATARVYREALTRPHTERTIRDLWQSTSIPYRMSTADPHSPAYRDEVMGLFKALTTLDYQSGLEMTSTKQAADSFEIGYPWVARDLRVAAAELAKPVQAMQALSTEPGVHRVVEFGSGWGNLALPLAKLGLDITAVDIDGGFLDRLGRIATRENVPIELLHCDFVDATNRMERVFDAAVFQSSFHHCADGHGLIARIRDQVLKPGGSIFFFSEPIYPNYAFPWGLRYDGEALWAIMMNHWLELGFDQDYFISLLNRTGFLVSKVPEIPNFVGFGWKATSASNEAPFGQLVWPSRYDATFYDADVEGWRFCRGQSSLPGQVGPGDNLEFTMLVTNFLSLPIGFSIVAGGAEQLFQLEASETQTVIVPVQGPEIQIKSQTHVPHALSGTGDMRELGVAVRQVAWRSRPSGP